MRRVRPGQHLAKCNAQADGNEDDPDECPKRAAAHGTAGDQATALTDPQHPEEQQDGGNEKTRTAHGAYLRTNGKSWRRRHRSSPGEKALLPYARDPMPEPRSDAFVFFGATGDLAFKQIFPALLGLIRDDGFDLPIIGLARSGDLDALRARARDSLKTLGSRTRRRPTPSSRGCAT